MSNTRIQYHSKEEAISIMNDLGKQRVAFTFVIDYEMEKIILVAQDEKTPIEYEINKKSKIKTATQVKELSNFQIQAVPLNRYEEAFRFIQNELHYGNSFLANLTFPSEISCNLTLEQLFHATEAKYKLHIPNQCIVFSPESFVQINEGVISSFPMKGTIQANLANAHEKILADAKEHAEHSTIVDLIRNDLSMVANKVKVDKFRYVERIENNANPLLQVSSQISGLLPKDYHKQLGSLFFSLLPAGSICGAPKKKTLEIIAEAEQEPRGYYTGVFGHFDGNNLDSAVMIRFIEQKEDKLFFRSGGGITAYSNLAAEYNELIDKIYVPLRKHTHIKRENLQSSLSSR